MARAPGPVEPPPSAGARLNGLRSLGMILSFWICIGLYLCAKAPGVNEFEFDLAVLPFEVLDIAANAAIDAGKRHSRRRRGARRQINVSSLLSPPRRNGKPLLWVHIHKAAGSFMCTMAKKARESVVQPNDNCNWREHDCFPDSTHEDRAPSCRTRSDYFSSHRYTYGQIERQLLPSDLSCGSHFHYGVFLREPIDLMLSTLNYNAIVYGGRGRLVLRDLEEQIKAGVPCYLGQFPEWKALDNFQARVLANAFAVPAGQLAQEHLARARDALAAFQVVARLEDMPTRGAALFEALGWSSHLAQVIGGKKPNAFNHSAVNFTPDEVEWLSRVNRFDIQLYNEAAGRPYKSLKL